MACASCQHGLGKMQRQIVLAQHGQHVHAFLVRRAEDFDDFAFGIGVARFPFAQFDDHLVADARGPAHVARRRHINVVRDARVIGNDVEKLFALRCNVPTICVRWRSRMRTTVPVSVSPSRKFFRRTSRRTSTRWHQKRALDPNDAVPCFHVPPLWRKPRWRVGFRAGSASSA